MFLFTFFFSLSLSFTLVAASISHFLTAAKKFSCYSSNEIGLLCFFLSLAPAVFIVTHVNLDIKFKSKERIGFDVVVVVVFFLYISKSPGGYAFYRRNAGVLEMQDFTPAYIIGWTYVRTIFSEPKLLRCIDNQMFLPVVLRCARELCYKFLREEK